MIVETPDIKRLRDASERIRSEIEALRNRLSGLEAANSFIEAEMQRTDVQHERAARGNVKTALLDLLLEAGSTGLNAATAVAMAQRRNIDLDRNTVSSLLSRMKRDGIVDHDGFRYRLRDARAAPRELAVA